MGMEREIRKAIDEVLHKLKLAVESYVVERPREEGHGDWASNVALVSYQYLQSGKTYYDPRELANDLVENLQKNSDLMKSLDGIEIAGPGFINFTIKTEWWVERLQEIVKQGKDWGSGDWGKGRQVLVEYSSPNIAKNFSVGHLRSTIIGQSIRNLFEFSGWKTVGDNHLGDWGTQFGMIIAAVEEGGLDLSEMTVEEMERLYVEYNQRAKEDESLREKAKEAFVRLEQGDEGARSIWQVAIDKSKADFEKIYKQLGVEIEHAYGESFYEEEMKEVIREVKEKGLARESKGALVMDLGDGLPVGMLVKSDGGTTYFTRDLATVRYRNRTQGLKSDLYVYEVGGEQSLHFKQVFAAVDKLGWVKQDNLIHVGHGMVLGEDGKKMSTRKGTGVRMVEWLDEIVKRAGEINKHSAEVVGIGAVKFFDLKHSPVTAYRFDQEEALRLDGYSGPYVQYATVRARRIIDTSSEVGKDISLRKSLDIEEVRVIKLLDKFPEVIKEAVEDYSPNLLADYVFDLAKSFNDFYSKHRVIDEGEVEPLRWFLTKGVVEVLEQGLGLLGIGVPERM